MEIKHLLALLCIVIFLGYFFLNKFPRRSYILFSLMFFPFIDLNITPEEYGSISVFDFMSYFVLFFTLDDFFRYSRKRYYYYFLVFLMVTLFVGSIHSEFIANSVFSLFKFLSVFIFSKMILDEYLEDPGFIKHLIKYLKLSCIISLIFLFVQLIIGVSFTFYPDLNPNVTIESNVLRYPSYFQDPQKYGQYLAMMSFIFLMLKEDRQSQVTNNIILFVLIIFALLLTGGRAAFLGFCLGLIIVLTRKGSYLIIGLIGCIAVCFINFYNSEYISLLNRQEDFGTSFLLRYKIWQENLQIFLSHPFLGIGIGNHHNYIVKYALNGYYIINNQIVYYGTENGYLKILIECGIFGFIGVFCLIVTTLVKAIRSYILTRNFNVLLLIASCMSWLLAFTTIYSLDDRRLLVVVATILSLLIISHKSTESIYA